jgi:hypothetical protein
MSYADPHTSSERSTFLLVEKAERCKDEIALWKSVARLLVAETLSSTWKKSAIERSLISSGNSRFLYLATYLDHPGSV